MNTSKIKVLLVDDDTLLGNTVADELNKRGYETVYLSAVYGVSEAIRQFLPDVLVFDVEIGKENGIETAINLFKGNPSLPIIFISSHHEDEMKEAGLMAGAVAYIDKPFTAKLLIAHIDRFTRMTKNASDTSANLFPISSMQLDMKNRALIFEDGSIVDLRPMEFNILRELTIHVNEIVSREDMYEVVWDKDTSYYNEQSLNNYIRRLRNILEPDNKVEISLHRGLGYKLKVKSED
ncbi:MAG: response regulator transcription factor [Proteiniphilum sp.]|nr:response regulator transcription factor [Proteiniphilum sp.]